MPGPYRIGIAGFGIGGGAAAVLLARSGHAVTLLERSKEVGPVGAGIMLQPSGQSVLHCMGLLQDVACRAEPLHELHAVTHTGRTLTQLSYSCLGPGYLAYGVHRAVLFDAIRRAVETENGDVRLGCPVHSHRQAGDSIFAVEETGREHGPFDLLVAADGSRSALRSALHPRVHEYAYGVLWAVGHCRAVKRKLLQTVSGTRYLTGLLPMGEDRCTLFWSARRDRQAEIRSAGFDAWRKEVVSLSPAAEEVFEDVRSFGDVTFTDYRHVTVNAWSSGRLVLLGDAAHAMSPHLGQGANLALVDAMALASAIERNEAISDVLRDYDGARRRQNRYYAFLTRLLTPFFQSDARLLGWGRDVALPLMCRMPALRREMTAAMAGMKPGFFGRLRTSPLFGESVSPAERVND